MTEQNTIQTLFDNFPHSHGPQEQNTEENFQHCPNQNEKSAWDERREKQYEFLNFVDDLRFKSYIHVVWFSTTIILKETFQELLWL